MHGILSPRVRRHRHPANIAHHDDRTFGQRTADQATAAFGSWRFIILQTIAVTAWVTVNLVGWLAHWDPYPFILLNLMFSTQAAYAAPLILLSQNRMAEHDRLAAEHDYAINIADAEVNKQTQQMLEQLHADHARFAEQHTEMLNELRETLRPRRR